MNTSWEPVPIHIVVLAAGKGTRMKSAIPKVLHPVAGSSLIDLVLTTASALSPQTVVVVLGHRAELVRAGLSTRSGLTFVVQEPQLGTGDALLKTAPVFDGAIGTLVLLSGDVPLLSTRTLENLIDHHVATYQRTIYPPDCPADPDNAVIRRRTQTPHL